MRRVIPGIAACGFGLIVYVSVSRVSVGLGGLLSSRISIWLGIGAAIGTYALADWLGLLPNAYEPGMRELLHQDPNESNQKDPLD